MASEPVVVTESGGTSTFHLSWGAVFGGTFVALGVWILLHALGLAAGLTAIDPDRPGSLRGVGIGTGIWSLIAPLLALFAGGFVGARTAGVIDRATGALHGAVLWGLTTVAGTALLALALTSVVGAVAQVARHADEGVPSVSLRLDVDDVLGPINQRLEQEGSPPVTSAQIQAATRDVVTNALAGGQLDRQALIDAIARNTAVTADDADRIAARVEAQVAQAGQKAERGALRAAEATGKALWGVFFALLLGLLSAIAGGMVGVSRRQRAALVGPMTVVPPFERRVPIEPYP